MQRIGPHEVAGELGRGGMGAVLRARAPDRRAVALELLLSTHGPQAAARFERERRLLASFGEAEGLVPLLDAGTGPQGPFIVMPLLRGGTLRARLATARCARASPAIPCRSMDAASSPDGRRALTASRDQTLRPSDLDAAAASPGDPPRARALDKVSLRALGRPAVDGLVARRARGRDRHGAGPGARVQRRRAVISVARRAATARRGS